MRRRSSSLSLCVYLQNPTTTGISTSYAHLEEQSTDVPSQKTIDVSPVFSSVLLLATALSSRVTQAIVICFSLFLADFCSLGKGTCSHTFARCIGHVWIVSKFNPPPNYYVELFNMKSKCIQTLYSSLMELTKGFEILVVTLKYYVCCFMNIHYNYVTYRVVESFSPNREQRNMYLIFSIIAIIFNYRIFSLIK